jgi:exodeoxyribonuclease-5
MQKDKFLNALRAKFGYAVTCHKAQGGEWPTVFLNLSQSINQLDPESRYRWLYTAVTRASETLELKHIWKGKQGQKKTVRKR